MKDILIVLATAASPIFELRAAIPLGIFGFNMEPILVFIISVLGNIMPVIFLLFFLTEIKLFLTRKSIFFRRFFESLDFKITNKFQYYFNKYKALGLLIFVAIPLPFTGAWSGSLAAVLFNIPKKQAFFLISGGILIAGIIVLSLIKLGILTFSS